MEDRSERYAVIGAGASGLAAGRALAAADVAFDILEKHHGVGGLWDIDNPGSPAYETAHFISSRTRSALSGFPFPDHYPDYPGHQELLAYLRAFARHHELEDHVEFDTPVAAVRPSGDGWEVELGSGAVRRYAGVVMASGNFWSPNLPSYPGEWAGEAYHSRDYRGPAELAGRRVLVVGAGNTGCDVASDAANVAAFAAISVRRGYRIVPKHLFGRPTDVFAAESPDLPGPLQQRVFNRLLDLVVGDLTRYGWPAPDHDVLTSHPILNTRIIDRLAHGDLAVRPDVDRLLGDRVRFVDGREEPYDLILWATGYRVAFPYLADDVIGWRGNDPDLFLNVFHRGHDGLFALGVLETNAGAFPHISRQAELVARVIVDQRERPEQAAAFRRLKRSRPDLSGGIEHLDSPRHAYYTEDSAYRRYTAALLEALRRGEVTPAWTPPSAAGRLVRGATSLVGRLIGR